MRTFNGLESMPTEDLREWFAAYREDLRNFAEANAATRAQVWARRTCGRIVCILARRNEPPKKKPPEIVIPAAPESHSSPTEIQPK